MALVVSALALPACAAPIANRVATFSGLDKITARVTKFDAYVGETVQFGSLQITARACYTNPAEETQRTAVFVAVDQVKLKGATERIFTGWMFADSPALNAIDDAVYDFWLVDCKQRSSVPPPQADAAPAVTTAPAEAPPQASEPAPAEAPAADEPPAQTQVKSGSFITLLNPNPSAETSPDN